MKSKQAEQAMSTLARQAREQYRHSIKKREIHQNKLVFQRVSIPINNNENKKR